MTEEYIVTSHADLEGANPSAKGKDRIIHELRNGEYSIIVWVERWIIQKDDKDLDTLPKAGRLIGAVDIIESKSGMAWGIIQDPERDPAWVPKSCSEVYKPHPHRGIELAPQKGLGDFA